MGGRDFSDQALRFRERVNGFPPRQGRSISLPKESLPNPGFPNLAKISAIENRLKANQLILITGETVDCLPSAGFWAIPQQIQIPLFAQIHPKKARELAVQSGDRILLENGKGKMEAPAWVTDQVEENMVFCPSGGRSLRPKFSHDEPKGSV